MARRKVAEKSADKTANKQMWAIILFALGIFFAAITLIKGENLWLVIHNFIMGLFGWSGFLIAPILIYIAVMATLDKPLGNVKHKLWQTFVLIALICGAVQIFGAGMPDSEGFFEKIVDLYEGGATLKGGGLASAIFGIPLLAIFPKIGAIITIVLLIFVFIMILTGGTLVGLFHYASKPIKHLEEAYIEKMEEGGTKKSKFNIDVPFGEKSEKSKPLRKGTAPKQEKVSKFAENTNNSPLETAKNRLLEAAEVYIEPPERDEKKSKSGRSGLVIEENPFDDEDDIKMQIDNLVSKFVFNENSKPTVEFDSEAVPLSVANQNGVTQDIYNNEEDMFAPYDQGDDIQYNVIKEFKPERPIYSFPPVTLLNEAPFTGNEDVTEELKANAARLVDTLNSFGVQTRIIDICRGPAVTRYELQPSAGVKISKITGLADDIALNLAAAGVRIEAPIPNKAAVGIEVPNKVISSVSIREVIDSCEFTEAQSKLSVALGRDITGNIAIADIGKMPHMLIAGSTGSGKSVCINSIIVSLLYKSGPDEVKFLMIDPKVVELGVYNGIPHLLVPVVTEPKKAAGALGWAVTEMLNRYKIFAENSVRDLAGYNRLCEKMSEEENPFAPMPHIVIIIDELADLMMAAPNEVEDSICRLAQMARAAGMHLIIATQRPSVDVITGVIKANIPSRIAFAVSSQIDSRTILDMGGAEKLLGRGDMLFSPVGSSKPIRVQGSFVTDTEVEKIVSYIKDSGDSSYDEQVAQDIEKHVIPEKISKKKDDVPVEGNDEMLSAAIQCVIDAGQASTSLLQRRFKLGYARAAKVIDQMESRGIIGPFEGSKPRQILISKERWLEMKESL